MHSAIILAGGKSSRLNTDKAFLRLKNKTIVERTIDELNDLFNEIIIVANSNLENYNSIIKQYNNKKIIIREDIIKNKGPLGGIYTGLKTAKDDNNFVLACDMPFINADLIKYMLDFNDFDVVVPRHEDIEPLHAIYNKNIIPVIENQIKNNELSIRATIEKIEKIKYIEKEEIEKFDKEHNCFFNINNEGDLEKARELAQ